MPNIILCIRRPDDQDVKPNNLYVYYQDKKSISTEELTRRGLKAKYRNEQGKVSDLEIDFKPGMVRDIRNDITQQKLSKTNKKLLDNWYKENSRGSYQQPYQKADSLTLKVDPLLDLDLAKLFYGNDALSLKLEGLRISRNIYAETRNTMNVAAGWRAFFCQSNSRVKDAKRSYLLQEQDLKKKYEEVKNALSSVALDIKSENITVLNALYLNKILAKLIQNSTHKQVDQKIIADLKQKNLDLCIEIAKYSRNQDSYDLNILLKNYEVLRSWIEGHKKELTQILGRPFPPLHIKEDKKREVVILKEIEEITSSISRKSHT